MACLDTELCDKIDILHNDLQSIVLVSDKYNLQGDNTNLDYLNYQNQMTLILAGIIIFILIFQLIKSFFD